MDVVTLPTAAVSITPSAPDSSKPTPTPPHSPKQSPRSPKSPPRPSACPFAALVPSSRPPSASAVGAHSRSACPFAALVPSASAPSQTEVVNVVASAEGSGEASEEMAIVVPRRRCPWWVRVLRFSAKYVAKQVVLRSVKSGIGKLVREMRK